MGLQERRPRGVLALLVALVLAQKAVGSAHSFLAPTSTPRATELEAPAQGAKWDTKVFLKAVVDTQIDQIRWEVDRVKSWIPKGVFATNRR